VKISTYSEEDGAGAATFPKSTVVGVRAPIANPAFSRGERVILKDMSDGQRVIFLKDNGDGTADVQVRTPGANRYMPEKVETRTVKTDNLRSSGIKNVLTSSEKAALENGIHEQKKNPDIYFATPELSADGRRQYDEVVRRYTNPDGMKRRGWMQAPNGKPTKLSERQWVQVRTPSFKKWFGDWENVELQNWLENSSVATATGKEYADIPKAELEDAIVSYFADKGIRSVENENVGKVNITRSGIHDSIAKGVGRMKIAAFNHLPEIISNGRVVAQETNWKERGYNTVTLAAPIEIGNKKHVALVTIRQYPNHDNNFYLHEVGLLDEIKREAERLYDTGLSQNGDKEARPLGSMRKIAQSLFAVNPSSVSKVVDENGEPMVVYHGTNNNFTVFSAEKMRPGAYGDGFYFATTPERARLYGDRIISVFLNAKADNRDAKRLGVEKDYIRTSAGDIIVKNPEQIKSATGNNGDFSQADNDVYFATPEMSVENNREQAYRDWLNKWNLEDSQERRAEFDRKNPVAKDTGRADKKNDILKADEKERQIRTIAKLLRSIAEGRKSRVEKNSDDSGTLAESHTRGEAGEVVGDIEAGRTRGSDSLDESRAKIEFSTKSRKSLTVSAGKVSTAEVRDLFDKLNTDEDTASLARKVFRAVEKLPIVFEFDDESLKVLNDPFGIEYEGYVVYNTRVFSAHDVPAQRKAEALLHEAIHAVTSYAIDIANGQSKAFAGIPISQELRDAVAELETLYSETEYFLRRRRATNYAQTTELPPDALANLSGDELRRATKYNRMAEFMAELSNADVRRELQAQTLWTRIVNGIRRIIDSTLELLGNITAAGKNKTDRKENALKVSYRILDKFLRNADGEAILSANDLVFENNESPYYDKKTVSGNTRQSALQFKNRGEDNDAYFATPELDPGRRAEEIDTHAKRYLARHQAAKRLASPTPLIMDAAEGKWSKFRRAVQDKNLLIRELEERLGVTDKVRSVYYAKDREFSLNEHQLTVLQKQHVEPIFERLAKTGASQEDFDLYLIARHAPYRNGVILGRTGTKDGSGM
ncbi:MAG: hypothetical protein J6R18_09910, partial [Kiritimatiellae bacterium]|nr:hypothetical protein [Kiritimatiellia bacterium]